MSEQFFVVPHKPKFPLKKASFERIHGLFTLMPDEEIESCYDIHFESIRFNMKQKTRIIPFLYYWLMYLLSCREEDLELLTLEGLTQTKTPHNTEYSITYSAYLAPKFEHSLESSLPSEAGAIIAGL